MSGVERLVPLTALRPVGLVELTLTTLTPHASTSGLRRPSAVGPSEENPAIESFRFAAPQVMTLNASAGAMIVNVSGSASCPAFPAAVKQTSPFAVAIFTARVVIAVSPSSISGVYQSMYPSELVARSAPFASMNSRPAT